MVWMLTPSGEFTIASALSVVRGHSHGSFGAACVWHGSLPITISFFMIRLLSSRLPLLDQVHRLGVHGPSRCFCCTVPQEERLNHLFCTGETARKVWRAFETQPGNSDRIYSVRHLAVSWWIRPAQQRYVAFVYHILHSLICWELRCARTRALLNGGRTDGGGVVDRVLFRLRELLHAQFPSIGWTGGSWESLYLALVARPKEITILQVKWVALNGGYKLNTDGCSLGNLGASRGGGVVRNSQGGFVLAFSCSFGVSTSLHAELKALAHGVQQCIAWGFLELHLEVDSLSLVRIMSGDQACPWQLQLEVDDLLQHRRLFRSITHCYREANKPSDRLAKWGAVSVRIPCLLLLPCYLPWSAEIDEWID
ncbi:uncharacterized protein LOC113751976 [Coffea eugenioides]|uniref:uncharacterized protein LOC113751976 n=1 Tax=Coffea eugenioides TaxID=49369 RepID=UPI000F60800C|nr:uncharacterized protein LOC113751976 [Coffea eugenioides]